MTGYWTTHGRPPQEQHAYWREVICAAFTPLTPLQRGSEDWRRTGVPGWVRSRAVADVNGAEIQSCRQLNVHGTAEVRRTVEPTVFVNLQLEGTCVGSQGGRTAVVRPGSFALFDATRPFRLDYRDDWRTVSFRVPRDRLMSLVRDPEAVTAVAHDGRRSVGAVVAGAMTTAWAAADTLDAEAARAVSLGFLTVLAAACGASGEVARRPLAQTLHTAVRAYLAANARRPDLTAEHVARHFGVSVRTLHNAFRDADLTFAQTVMALRVEGCARELRDPDRRGSLTELATRWGFYDLSHLNRVFRAHMGCRPAEYR